MKAIQVGDQVQFKAAWCRSTGQFTGDVPFAVGKVEELTIYAGGKLTIAQVKWNNDEIPPRVNVKNLKRKGDLELP